MVVTALSSHSQMRPRHGLSVPQAPELEGPKPTVTVSSSQATPWESGHRVKQKNLGAQNLWPLTNTYFLLWLAG